MSKDTITRIENTWEPYSEAGFEVENEFYELLKKYHPNCVRQSGKFKEYDIKCEDPNCVVKHKDKVPYYYEIKRDMKSHMTGNFAVEVSCKDIPSGITTTKSTFWVFVDGLYFWVIETDKLRRLTESKFAQSIDSVVNGGDSNLSLMVLISKTEVESIVHALVERT